MTELSLYRGSSPAFLQLRTSSALVRELVMFERAGYSLRRLAPAEARHAALPLYVLSPKAGRGWAVFSLFGQLFIFRRLLRLPEQRDLPSSGPTVLLHVS